MNWKAVERAFSEPQLIYNRNKLKSIIKTIRHIRMYKVHGSLNYIYHHNSIIENTAWLWKPPSFMKRVIITPGASKYKALQHYRQELIQTADIAIDKSSRFLFLGYGFNDTHLEVYIQKKLVEHKSRCLIVTRDTNERIESLLKNADNSWLICRSKDNSGSQIYNNQYADWLSIKGKNIWDIKNFEEYIFGGI
jgi:virulence-associated protein VapD